MKDKNQLGRLNLLQAALLYQLLNSKLRKKTNPQQLDSLARNWRLITRQQGDSLKQFAEQREQAQEQALANGQAVGSCPGLGMGSRAGTLKNGTFGPGSCGMFGGRWGGAGRRGAATAGGSSSSY